jgi:YHS domain-containing protein
MLARLLYFVLLTLLARFLLRSLSEWMGQEAARRRVHGPQGRGGPRTLHRGAMVRDPVCGLHLPKDRALVEMAGSEPVYFCSETCRARYRSARA